MDETANTPETTPEREEPRATIVISVDDSDTLKIVAPNAQVAEAVLLRALAWVQRQLVIEELKRAMAGPRIVAPNSSGHPRPPLRPLR